MSSDTSFPQRSIEELRLFLEGADPSLYSPDSAADLLESVSVLERLCVGVRLLFASRAARSTRWTRSGHRSAESWLADTCHSSLAEAASSIETSSRLESLDSTSDALRRGDLSLAQAKEITSAAEKDPGAEKKLVETARNKSLKNLKDEARRVRHQASSSTEENERYRAIHASRYCRHWSDEEGAVRLEARLAPDQGARLVSALETETDAIFDEARSKDTREHPQAYRADALVSLVTGASRHCGANHRKPGPAQNGSSKSGPQKSRCVTRTDTVSIRVDAEALRRGHVGPGEICEIPGVGPVPVANARRLLGEGFVKVVIKDAVDVLSVCHVGRTVPAHLQTALEERDPTCVLCDCAFGLEMHHWKEDYAKSKSTSLDGLARVCKHHHDLITYEGFRLVGGPGNWRLLPPPARAPAPAPKILDSG